MSKPARPRKILGAELARLGRLAEPVNVAFDAVEDARLAFNEKKAAYETLAALYTRYGRFLVKRYAVKDDEEIDQFTGLIQKKKASDAAPKPPMAQVKRGR